MKWNVMASSTSEDEDWISCSSRVEFCCRAGSARQNHWMLRQIIDDIVEKAKWFTILIHLWVNFKNNNLIKNTLFRHSIE